jgi:hypothetical protein
MAMLLHVIFYTSAKMKNLDTVTFLKSMPALAGVFFEEAASVSGKMLNALIQTVERDENVYVEDWFLSLFNISQDLDLSNARFFAAYNPFKVKDDIVAKFETYDNHYIYRGNVFDLDFRGQDNIQIDGNNIQVEDIKGAKAVDFRDPKLLRLADAEKDEPYAQHSWYGHPWMKFKGAPFAKHRYVALEEMDAEGLLTSFRVEGAWLDPAHQGKDSTALCFHGIISLKEGGEFDVFFGYLWDPAWDMVATEIVEKLKEFGLSRLLYETNGTGHAPVSIFRDLGVHAKGEHTALNKVEKVTRAAAKTKDNCLL